MQRIKLAAVASFVLILAVVGPALAQSTIADAVVIATNSVELNMNSMVEGNVVVNEPSRGPVLSGAADLEVEKTQMIDGDLFAESIELARGAVIDGDLFVDSLNDRGAAFVPGSGTIFDYVPPIFATLPLFPAIAAPAGEVVVGAGPPVSLIPGAYGDVKIDKGATLILDGSYTFRSLTGIGSGGQCTFPCRSVLFSGPTILRIAELFDAGKGTFVGPEEASSLLRDALNPTTCPGSESFIQIAGTNLVADDPNSLPPAARSGRDGAVCATLHVPNGTYLQDKNSVLVGAVLARDVRIDQGAKLIEDSGFAAQALVALSCNAVLDGENAITILLEGFDPAGENLTFDIVSDPSNGAIVQGPDPIVPGIGGRCELSQLSCENPGTASGCPLAGESCEADGLCSESARPCCPDAGDICEPLGFCSVSGDQCTDLAGSTDCPSGETCVQESGSVTQATVVYQPNTPCDEQEGCEVDSFSFKVTNESGEMSAPTICEINRPDPGAPGVIENVQANDDSVDTPVSSVVRIRLGAGSPEGVTSITFSIEELPTAGTLTLPLGGAVAAGDDLPGASVIYTAPADAGTDSFLFGARETGTAKGTPCLNADLSDPTDACGKISIDVQPALRLAGGDRTVETNLNQPVLVNLIANIGGAGTPVAAPLTQRIGTRAAAESWNPADSMELPRAGHRAVRLEDKILVTDGSTAELYDPDLDIWEATGGPVVAHGDGFTLTRLAGGRALLLGGENAQQVAEIYDPATGQFSEVQTGQCEGPCEARAFHTATLLADGRVLIAGGVARFPETVFDPVCNPNGCEVVDTLSGAEIFDPATGAFTVTGSMQGPRFEHAAVLLADGRVLVAGSEDTPPNCNLCFDGTGQCSGSGDLCGGDAACAEGESCRLGSCSESQTECVDDTECPEGESCVLNEEPFCAGVTCPPFLNPTLEIWDPESGEFTAAGDEFPFGPIDFENLTATRLADDQRRVLFIGGNAQLFTPAPAPGTGTLGPVIPLEASRVDHTATLLATGEVLVAGGRSGSTTLAGAVLFDPRSDTFRATSSMGTGRKQHSASLLPNGQVLVAGGSDGNGTTLASAELYSRVSTEPTLVLRVEALSGGTLRTLSGEPVVVGTTTFTSTTSLLYSPPIGVSDTQQMTYSVTESGLITDSAIIGIVILADQCVVVGRQPGCSPGSGLTAPTQVTAAEPSFDGPRRGLTLAVEGDGGSVASTSVELPAGRVLSGLHCASGGGECNKVFPAGSRVKLFARPDGEHFEFLRWEGDCRGAEPILTVDLELATSCVAVFGPRSVDP